MCRVDLKDVVTHEHFKLKVDIVDTSGSHKSDYILEGIMAINVSNTQIETPKQMTVAQPPSKIIDTIFILKKKL